MLGTTGTLSFQYWRQGDQPTMSEFPIVIPDPGVTRQVLANHPDLMVVSFCFEKGAEGKLHNHPHVQSTYVKAGKFLFSMDGVETEYSPGDSFVIPSNAVHGCVCLEQGELVDCFTPRRDDFL
jgi:quercetin dioxygenase-like cupin family protein